MEKTIREWLEELPEPYRTQALENTSKTNLQIFVSNIKTAIQFAFIWSDSDQGHNYWSDLHQSRKIDALTNYWQKRCKLAEAIIEASPFDRDITAEQIAAWHAYRSFLKERNEN